MQKSDGSQSLVAWHRRLVGKSLVALLALLAVWSVTAWASNPLVLSGSPNGTGTISVDDDLDVYLNGIQIYSDGSAGAGSRSPISFSANTGDTLRFVVRDTFGVCSHLLKIYLTNTTWQSVLADPGFDLGCGRPSGDQGIVHDLSFTIPDFSPKDGDLVAVEGTLMYKVNPATGARTVLTDFSNAARSDRSLFPRSDGIGRRDLRHRRGFGPGIEVVPGVSGRHAQRRKRCGQSGAG